MSDRINKEKLAASRRWGERIDHMKGRVEDSSFAVLENQTFRHRVMLLLKSEHITEAQRKFLLVTQSVLFQSEKTNLFFWQAKRLDAIETYILMRVAGRNAPATPESDAAFKKKRALLNASRKDRRTDPKTARPDWMQDPSKLPKRPPGKS
jgi:hypothetical protein